MAWVPPTSKKLIDRINRKDAGTLIGVGLLILLVWKFTK